MLFIHSYSHSSPWPSISLCHLFSFLSSSASHFFSSSYLLLLFSPFHFQQTCFSVRRIMALVYAIYPLPPSQLLASRTFLLFSLFHFNDLLRLSLPPLTPACWLRDRMISSVKHHFSVTGLDSQYVSCYRM